MRPSGSCGAVTPAPPGTSPHRRTGPLSRCTKPRSPSTPTPPRCRSSAALLKPIQVAATQTSSAPARRCWLLPAPQTAALLAGVRNPKTTTNSPAKAGALAGFPQDIEDLRIEGMDGAGAAIRQHFRDLGKRAGVDPPAIVIGSGKSGAGRGMAEQEPADRRGRAGAGCGMGGRERSEAGRRDGTEQKGSAIHGLGLAAGQRQRNPISRDRAMTRPAIQAAMARTMARAGRRFRHGSVVTAAARFVLATAVPIGRPAGRAQPGGTEVGGCVPFAVPIV